LREGISGVVGGYLLACLPLGTYNTSQHSTTPLNSTNTTTRFADLGLESMLSGLGAKNPILLATGNQ